MANSVTESDKKLGDSNDCGPDDFFGNSLHSYEIALAFDQHLRKF